MVVKKINRINLLELKQITVRCKRCGASITLNSEAANYKLTFCPECRAQYSAESEEIIKLLSRAFYLAGKNQEEFVVEFDIEET